MTEKKLLFQIWEARAEHEPQFSQALELEKYLEKWRKANEPKPNVRLNHDCMAVLGQTKKIRVLN